MPERRLPPELQNIKKTGSNTIYPELTCQGTAMSGCQVGHATATHVRKYRDPAFGGKDMTSYECPTCASGRTAPRRGEALQLPPSRHLKKSELTGLRDEAEYVKNTPGASYPNSVFMVMARGGQNRLGGRKR